MRKSLFIVGLAMTLNLVGCSEDESAKSSTAPITSNTPNVTPVQNQQPAVADVKQPARVQAPSVSTKTTTNVAAATMSGAELYESCVGCHGADGGGGVGPRLRGLTLERVEERITGYKEGKTYGPLTSMMTPNVAAMTATEIRAVSEYIAQLR